MNWIELNADALMCVAWIATYVLVLISMHKEQIPVMSPITSAVIFPWEFVMASKDIIYRLTINYALIAHFGFALLQAAIIYVILFKIKYYKKKEIICYLSFIMLLSIFITLCFTNSDLILYTSYINTIIGVMFWMIYFIKSTYSFSRLNGDILIVKLLADILGYIAYHNYDNIVFWLSILLPIIDVLHIGLFYIYKSKKIRNI